MNLCPECGLESLSTITVKNDAEEIIGYKLRCENSHMWRKEASALFQEEQEKGAITLIKQKPVTAQETLLRLFANQNLDCVISTEDAYQWALADGYTASRGSLVSKLAEMARKGMIVCVSLGRYAHRDYSDMNNQALIPMVMTDVPKSPGKVLVDLLRTEGKVMKAPTFDVMPLTLQQAILLLISNAKLQSVALDKPDLHEYFMGYEGDAMAMLAMICGALGIDTTFLEAE